MQRNNKPKNIFHGKSIPITNETGINNFILHNKRLVKIVDVLGRESKEIKNQILYYIYDNGTVEKKMIAE